MKSARVRTVEELRTKFGRKIGNIPHPYTNSLNRVALPTSSVQQEKKKNKLMRGKGLLLAISRLLLENRWGFCIDTIPKSYCELAGVHSTDREGKRLQLRQRTKQQVKGDNWCQCE